MLIALGSISHWIVSSAIVCLHFLLVAFGRLSSYKEAYLSLWFPLVSSLCAVNLALFTLSLGAICMLLVSLVLSDAFFTTIHYASAYRDSIENDTVHVLK